MGQILALRAAPTGPCFVIHHKYAHCCPLEEHYLVLIGRLHRIFVLLWPRHTTIINRDPKINPDDKYSGLALGSMEHFLGDAASWEFNTVG